MKHLFNCMIFFCFFSVLSCTPGSDVGELYGRWKLISFICPSDTVRPDTIFIGFQGNAYSYQPNWTYNWGVYIKTDHELFLNKLQYGGDFSAIFIKEETALFKIDILDDEKMILSRNDSVWVFDKFL